MPNSYTSLRYHVTFSTKDRFPWITEDWKTDLYRYIGGIVRGQQGKLIEIGGRPIICTCSFPCEPIRLFPKCYVKLNPTLRNGFMVGGSSEERSHWQRGYGGFTVSRSAEERIAHYIRNQQAHHRKMSFQEEFLKLLKAHGVEYDERYIWL